MKAAVRFRINQKIKFLYIKKQKVNETTGPTTTNDTATTNVPTVNQRRLLQFISS